ncbi:hypothetical protein D3C81_2318690 [compost metagenome]
MLEQIGHLVIHRRPVIVAVLVRQEAQHLLLLRGNDHMRQNKGMVLIHKASVFGHVLQGCS